MVTKKTPRLAARLLIGNQACKGIVSDLANNRLIIHTRAYLPFNETFTMLLFHQGRRIAVTVKITAFLHAEISPYSVAVTVINPSLQYLNLVSKLRPLHKTRQIFFTHIQKNRTKPWHT
jgi:hypothetical protein